MAHQVSAKVLDLLTSLHDLLDLFAREIVRHSHLVGHDFHPNIDHASRKRQGEVNQEYRRSKLEETEVIKRLVEVILLGLLILGRLLLLLFVLSFLLFLEVELEDIVDLSLLAHGYILFALDEHILRILGEHFTR